MTEEKAQEMSRQIAGYIDHIISEAITRYLGHDQWDKHELAKRLNLIITPESQNIYERRILILDNIPILEYCPVRFQAEELYQKDNNLPTHLTFNVQFRFLGGSQESKDQALVEQKGE